MQVKSDIYQLSSMYQLSGWCNLDPASISCLVGISCPASYIWTVLAVWLVQDISRHGPSTMMVKKRESDTQHWPSRWGRRRHGEEEGVRHTALTIMVRKRESDTQHWPSRWGRDRRDTQHWPSWWGRGRQTHSTDHHGEEEGDRHIHWPSWRGRWGRGRQTHTLTIMARKRETDTHALTIMVRKRETDTQHWLSWWGRGRQTHTHWPSWWGR